MKISQDMLKEMAKELNSPERIHRRQVYYQMYKIYHGGLNEILEETIKKEFSNPDAVTDLLGRLVPINILKKVVKKKASVYTESPLRDDTDDDTDDADLVEDFEDALKINIVQKQANRYLELFQKNCKEIFASKMNETVLAKNLPPHSYEAFNYVNPDKSKPDVVCKIIKQSAQKIEQVLYFYSDESFFATNGEGEIIHSKMSEMKNPNGINPSGQLPFVYKTKSTDSVDPVLDESLLKISIAIPIVITDMFFACKYQCWSILYTVGVKGEISRDPSSVIPLDFSDAARDAQQQPVIGSIDPKVDVEKIIGLINFSINLFLSTMGMSGGSISTGVGADAKDVLSGVSKVMDSAEVIEDRKDQQDDMLDDENMTWDKIKKMIPYWRANGLLPDQLNREFSQGFRISVSFKDPKPLLSEADALTLSDKRMKQKMTTWTRELKLMYPDYNDDQIEELKEEILEEHELYPEIYNPMGLVMDDQNSEDNENPNKKLSPSEKRADKKKAKQGSAKGGKV